jgi:hypothetical protein
MCHIETIFILSVTAWLIYTIFFRKGNKSTFTHLEEMAQYIVDASGVPKSEEKKHHPKFNKHEERCREIFQDIFDVEFKTIRPKWLENPATKKPLELDGYNPDIMTPLGRGLAFEYDGVQHAKYTPRFHQKEMDFAYQLKKDSWKDAVCRKRRLMLIRIPNFVAYHDLERYIKQSLRRNGMGRYIK